MEFFVRLAKVFSGLAPVLSAIASVFLPGVSILPKILSVLPELITVAEKMFGFGMGDLKKEYVMEGAQKVVDTMADLSTGGQKETWESVKPFVSSAVDGIITAVNTFEEGSFNQQRYDPKG